MAAIRFKFRSSIQYDSVDIDNRPSISVRDLRLKIVRHKNLDACQDFDLVFSDDITGEEYIDENFQIPTGSSIIIKRIPAGLGQSATGACNELSNNFKVNKTKVVGTTEPPKVMDEMDDFGDFGLDCCPVPEVTSLDCELDPDKRYCSGGDTNDIVPRLRGLGVPLARCQVLQVSDPREACPKDTAAELQSNQEEQFNTNKVVVSNHPSIHTHGLPSELRCSLCDTFFKDAMMIPCCQHSFCKKCIQAVLVDKARCPKCCSTKCRVEDLLPNVCLSQAIDRFLVTQTLPNVSDNAFLRDAPDGESAIHGRDMSCGVHREKIVAKSAYDGKIEHNDEEGGGSTLPEVVKDGTQADSQGENQPVNFPQASDSVLKRKRELRINITGGGRSFVETGRYIKGDRACYMCGSPDHLMRDCPASSNPPMFPSGNAMFPGAIPGYVPPYWNGAPSPHMMPLANPYCNPGMIPFNNGMVARSPFAVSSYMASVYGSAPFHGGYTRMGPLASHIGMNVEHPLNRPMIESFQEREERWKHSKEIKEREQSYDDADEDADFNTSLDYNEMGRSHYHKSHRDLEKSLSRSEDSFTKKSRRKLQRHKDDPLSADNSHERNSRSSISGRDRRSYQLERSSSIVENKSNAFDGHTDDSHKHHHRSYKVHKESKGQCSSDSSGSHHKSTGERHVKKYGVDSHLKRHNERHGGLFKSALVATLSNAKKEHPHGKDHRHGGKDKTTAPIDDRWQMIGGSDDDYREEDHHHRKRKKVY